MKYKLTRLCEKDIADVYRKGAALFGVEQADRYQNGLKSTLELLAQNPRLARERTELRRPVRLHPYQSHVIVYVTYAEEILILRILHSRQDWARILQT